MNDSKKDTQSSVASRERNRVQFKKNMKPRRAAQPVQAEMFQLTDQQNWFEDSGQRMFKGVDYLTKEEDLHKFIKYLKGAMTKQDFYRYETATDTD